MSADINVNWARAAIVLSKEAASTSTSHRRGVSKEAGAEAGTQTGDSDWDGDGDGGSGPDRDSDRE